jgi:NitT/TauT family transport system substrate-binding protein
VYRSAHAAATHRNERIEKENLMHRHRFLASAAAVAGAAVAGRIAPGPAAREVLVAEPVHSTGYLPLYIAMANGYFEDIKVNLVTIETGSGHTNAALSGRAFAFIGGRA